jgi:hypothetical protein
MLKISVGTGEAVEVIRSRVKPLANGVIAMRIPGAVAETGMVRRAAIGAALGVFALTGASAAAGDKGDAALSAKPSVLEETAARYILLRAEIDHLETMPIENASAMREAHNRLASFDPDDMDSAWLAYAALVAADTPIFAEAIEKRTNRPRKREEFLAELRTNPVVVRELEGANEAIEAIMAVAARDATRINALGDRFIADAYRMQEFGWAKKAIGVNGTQRLALAQDYASKREWPVMMVETKQVTDAGNVRPNLFADAVWTPEWSPTSTPPEMAERTGILMSRALVLAARYVVNDIAVDHVAEYAQSKASDRCFVNAKLNLDQCIAATRTPYEEAFCLGEHGLNDVSYCVGWVASAGRVKD